MKRFIIACALFALPATAQQITVDDLYHLPDVDIIFLGEVHDNPTHHENQRAAIHAQQPAGLVFEMLTADQATLATPDARTDQARLRAALDWDSTGWPDFSMYYPLFTAAPQAAIFGAELPREDARAVMGQPLEQVFAGDAARFGLDRPLPAMQQETREALQAQAHCDALPEALLPGMVAIQRLRDAMLAQAALDAHDATGGPVVVITGTGHTRTDWAAPALVAMAAPELRTLSIGQFESPPDTPAHDMWLVTAPHPRPDPCAAFQ
ncbi:ChaN family lipoprotein [Roseinatronobacter alkalisoli]|uniref:ChaN family lipoprotein n=1 Tax=Roseinatronobacter alkalisoli TaxID=3028235 RepID=A0ABT5T7B7_9RHOB|nr:ChaN family lipoprotein [Roseinatronobacter sp. HJB301]MDD7970580.1 ChaN family lipoprotein [Roseinatronobacter sp. HJB301]